MDIRVLKFETRYNRDKKPVDYVLYGPGASIGTTQTWARVADLVPPDDDADNSDAYESGLKMTHMRAVWSVIGPKYEAWVNGREAEVTGTPLRTWAGVDEAQIMELNRVGIMTVEALAGVGDNALKKINIPEMAELRQSARDHLETNPADLMAEIQALKDQLAKDREEKPKRGRPRKSEAA